MTPLGELLAAAIERSGPIPFDEFMAHALYHPEYGYYRRPRDPFGKDGDFFTKTAAQVYAVYEKKMRDASAPWRMGAPQVLIITTTPSFSFGRIAMYDGIPFAFPLCQRIGCP